MQTSATYCVNSRVRYYHSMPQLPLGGTNGLRWDLVAPMFEYCLAWAMQMVGLTPSSLAYNM